MNKEAEKLNRALAGVVQGHLGIVMSFSLAQALREERRLVLEQFASRAFRNYLPGDIVAGYQMEDEDDVAAEFNLLYRRSRTR